MLYSVLKVIMRLTLRVYYRHIYINGLANIPVRGGVILACNHPNSFLDAMILACYSPRPLNFLARSDIFNKPWKAWILRQLHLIPIYRLQEGAGNLDKNNETFSYCHQLLARGEVILIFSEGICVQEMRLRKLKKGTARIALSYAALYGAVQVVAIGFNYPAFMTFRGSVYVSIAEPFDGATYTALFKSAAANALQNFNEKLTTLLQRHVLEISEAAVREKLNRILTQRAGRCEVLSPPPLTSLMAAELPRQPQLPKWLATLAIAPAMVFHGVPLVAAQILTRATVKRNEFYDSVLISSAMFITLTFHLLAILFLAGQTVFIAAVYMITIIATGWLGLRAFDRWPVSSQLR